VTTSAIESTARTANAGPVLVGCGEGVAVAAGVTLEDGAAAAGEGVGLESSAEPIPGWRENSTTAITPSRAARTSAAAIRASEF
jgi:hypothetical protein